MGKKDHGSFRFDIDPEDERIDLDDMFEEQARSVTRLAQRRTLVLNADYQPLSYRPLSTIPWTKVMFWLAKGEARVSDGGQPIIHVVEEYDDVVRTGSREIRIPSVVAHTTMVPLPERPAMTRANLYLRDDYTCQYTGVKYPPCELSLDHVIPQSRGGKSNWENLVTCHKEVNFQKADKTPREAGLKLLRQPYVPNTWELRERGRGYPAQVMHESWQDYLFWHVELEED